IADISRELFPGFRQEPTLYPSLLQMLRTSDAVLLNSDSTQLHHLETERLIGRYTDELDKRLEELPAYPEGHVEQIVNTGAWAYFTFVKMQPLVDGNKRVGRMILKRVLKGGGFRDIIFNNPRWFGVPHPGLLEAYERTARTGNL